MKKERWRKKGKGGKVIVVKLMWIYCFWVIGV